MDATSGLAGGGFWHAPAPGERRGGGVGTLPGASRRCRAGGCVAPGGMERWADLDGHPLAAFPLISLAALFLRALFSLPFLPSSCCVPPIRRSASQRLFCAFPPSSATLPSGERAVCLLLHLPAHCGTSSCTMLSRRGGRAERAKVRGSRRGCGQAGNAAPGDNYGLARQNATGVKRQRRRATRENFAFNAAGSSKASLW